MNKKLSVSLAALILAGCASTPTEDRQAPRLYSFLDPSSGITYQLPGRCDLCAARESVVAAGEDHMAAREAGGASLFRKVASQGGGARIEPAVVASVTPISDVAPVGVAVAPAPAAGHEAHGLTAMSPAAPDSSQGLNLKLDTEFASAKRLISFALGRGGLGPTGKLAVAELAPWAKRAEKVHLRGGADSSGNLRRNRELAMARASSVRSAFVAAGVDRRKVSTTYCTTCYVTSNDTDEGRKINRRVEVELVLKQELAALMPKPVYAFEPPPSTPLIPATALNLPAR